LSVDPGSVAEQVRASGRVSLVSTAHDFELQLQPSDLRGPNYRAEQTDADGVVRATAMPGSLLSKVTSRASRPAMRGSRSTAKKSKA
jgi:hypothetical protein